MKRIYGALFLVGIVVQAIRLSVGFHLADGIEVGVWVEAVLGTVGFLSAACLSGAVGLLMLRARYDVVTAAGAWALAGAAAVLMTAAHLAIIHRVPMYEAISVAFLLAHVPSVVLSASAAISIDLSIVLLARNWHALPHSASREDAAEPSELPGDEAEAEPAQPKVSTPAAVGGFSLRCELCREWDTGPRGSKLEAVRALNGHQRMCRRRNAVPW